MELDFTLENNHFGGRTDTGNARNADIGGVNCVFFDELELVLPLALGSAPAARLLGDTGTAPTRVLGKEVELYQDSNGGENWDRYRAPEFHPRPNSYVSFRGYRVFSGEEEIARGDRAIGLLALEGERGGALIGVADFWQNFPKALAATPASQVRIGL